jgi:uncharacterized RDD family membrane protein YckC
MSEQQYAGFWIRVLAHVIDTVLFLLIITPLLMGIYGGAYYTSESMFQGVWDFILNLIFPAVVCIVFWKYKSATPGKMILKIKVVDAQTGQKLSWGQSIGRYFGYFVSILPIMLGFIWVAIDQRKQGWHDKLAGTVVIREG